MKKLEVTKIASLSGHSDCIYTLERAEKEHLFYSAGGDGMVVRWDLNNVESGELIIKAQHSIYALHLLDDNKHLILGENFEGIHSINLIEKKESNSSAITNSNIFDIQSYKNKIIAVTGDGHVIILNEKDLSTLVKIKLSDRSARCISINSDTGHLAIGLSDYFVQIIDLETLNLLHGLSGHTNSVFTVTYSPDRKYLLTGGRDAQLKIWDVTKGYQLVNSIAAHMYAINHIVYSPDGQYFATCSMDKSIKIWDANEFKLLKVIDKSRHTGHGTSVNKLLWSTYNNILISCSDDRTISLWDLKCKN